MSKMVAIVNAVTGNLVLQAQDEQLAGCGLDLLALRSYNSLGTPTDGDGDGWRWGYEQTVRFQGPGTPAQPQAGAAVIRADGDGHETAHSWDAARAAYLGTEGGGAHDELRYDSGSSEWVWTDGSTRVVERYSNSTSSGMTGRLIRRTDPSDNSIVLAYDGGRLTLIRDTASQHRTPALVDPISASPLAGPPLGVSTSRSPPPPYGGSKKEWRRSGPRGSGTFQKSSQVFEIACADDYPVNSTATLPAGRGYRLVWTSNKWLLLVSLPEAVID